MSEPVIHTRREFLGRSVALLSASATVPMFLDRTAWAIADPKASGKSTRGDEPILVVVQLAGGNDGLNTVIPFRNDRYYQARPRIAIKKNDALKLTDDLGLHPAAKGLKSLYDEGLLSIVLGVGYPNPDRSHFVATDIWSTGDPSERMHTGWLGRYLDCTCAGADRPNPRSGIAIANETPLAMTGERFSPVSFATPDQLSWRGPGVDAKARSAFEKFNDAEGHGTTADKGPPRDQKAALSYLQRIAMDARASAREIQDAAGGASNRRPGRERLGGRGGALSQQLAMVRRMIAAGLKTRVYYVSMGGFDTHAGQLGRQQQLLAQLGDALAEFVRGLRDDGTHDRVLTMTFSEFGRRVAENGSQGTDHGAAAPLFVVGSRVRHGLIGEHPSLEPAKLDRGDLKWGVDFRSIYAAVLTQWLKADAAKVLGGTFEPVKLF